MSTERISEERADPSSTIMEIMARDQVNVRGNIKKSFSQDVASLKDLLSSPMDVLDSFTSTTKSNRKHSNLINKDRQCDLIDLSVNMCGEIIENKEEDGQTKSVAIHI